LSSRIAEELTERFTPTHRVERIWSTDRRPEEYPFKSTYLEDAPGQLQGMGGERMAADANVVAFHGAVDANH
jgi:hypothetical protein